MSVLEAGFGEGQVGHFEAEKALLSLPGPGSLGKSLPTKRPLQRRQLWRIAPLSLALRASGACPRAGPRGNITAASSSFGTAGEHSRIPGSVMLRTVPVWLRGEKGQKIKANAFLDDGSDTTYVRDDVATALGLCSGDSYLRVSTLTDRNVQLKSRAVPLGVESLDGSTKSRSKLGRWKRCAEGSRSPTGTDTRDGGRTSRIFPSPKRLKEDGRYLDRFRSPRVESCP